MDIEKLAKDLLGLKGHAVEPSTIATAIVDGIISDFRSRKGLRHEWENIDEDVQQEIREAWDCIVQSSLDEARPALQAAWKPIETGPRNWSNILLFEPEYECTCPEDGSCDCPAFHNKEERVFQGYFSCADGGSNQWMECGVVAGRPCNPTHWQPLPSPPRHHSGYRV